MCVMYMDQFVEYEFANFCTCKDQFPDFLSIWTKLKIRITYWDHNFN